MAGRSRLRRCARSRSISRTELSRRVRSQSPIALSFSAKRETAAPLTLMPCSSQRRGGFGRRAHAVERLHDGDFDGTEAEVLAGGGILHDEALLAPVGLLHQDQIGAEARALAHGRCRTTFSPGARPLTTSIRSPGSSRSDGHLAQRRYAPPPTPGRNPRPLPRGARRRHAARSEPIFSGHAAARRHPLARRRAAARPRGCRWLRRSRDWPGPAWAVASSLGPTTSRFRAELDAERGGLGNPDEPPGPAPAP